MTGDARGRLNRFAAVGVVLLAGAGPALAAKTKHRGHVTPARHPAVSQIGLADGAPGPAFANAAPAGDPSAAEPSGLLPETARVYQRSYDEEAAGRFAQALSALGALGGPEQAGYLAHLRRGWLLYRLGRYAESVAAYRQALALERDSLEARLGCLMPQMALRDWAAVEQGARAALERDPASYLAGLRLAFAVYSTGRFAEAEGLYRRVVARYPSDADARAGLGWSLLRQGKRPEAREQFLQAARVAPRSALVLEGLKTSAD
ncbi:MAG TPA: tetratricopeptide repeat protein [Polyangia bacterium]|nr:tetratricopeptide repeat protein [Polyangia bacterium]